MNRNPHSIQVRKDVTISDFEDVIQSLRLQEHCGTLTRADVRRAAFIMQERSDAAERRGGQRFHCEVV